MSRKLYVKTLGCQMNEYDSARMADLLAETHDLQVTDRAEDADVLLLNTCSVREKAEEKVYSQLGRWKQWKAQRPGLVIGVGGCVASQEGGAIRRRAPHVDLVFGPQSYHRLPRMLDEATAGRPQTDTSFPEIEKFDRLPPPRVHGPRAFVSIMEGCSKYCTFCIVPYTRGEEFSRGFDEVITEIWELARCGVREVTLLGQNVNAWRARSHTGADLDFAELLRYVAAVDGIERIRYTTSHPLDFTDRLVDVYGELPSLVSHVHLPVQSGSDRILASMKRGYGRAEYVAIVDKLASRRADLSLSSDFIVGFPGETEADLEATLDLIEELRFDQSFSFLYSPRPGTPAASMTDATPLAVRRERLARLQERLGELAATHSKAMVGTRQQVLVDGRARRDRTEWSGRTGNNRVVNFCANGDLLGQLLEVEITEARPNSLRGVLPDPQSGGRAP